jgi:DNA adenine methylase
VPEGFAQKAARFIYLNRTCWNGLYRVNLNGEFNVPIGTKTSVLLGSDDFPSTSQTLQSATLIAGDFEVAIDQAQAGDVVFCDPPYTVRHNNNGFVKYNEQLFVWQDQVRLKDSLERAQARGARVFVTNADHESVRELYSGNFKTTALKRFSPIGGTNAVRGKYSELLISG